MMPQDKSRNTVSSLPLWVRKGVIPALIGGVVGFAASWAMLRFIGSDAVGGLDASATIAALIGALYVVIGISIVIGAARPRLGARFLNVEDADELREQKKVLTLSGVAMALWGVSMIALAFAAPGGPLPQPAALVVGAGGLAIGSWLSLPLYRAFDELMRAVNLEAGALGYIFVLLIGGGWAMLAHLGYAPAPAPLDWLSLFFVLMLLASFIAVGRRGMLMPR